MIRYAVAQKNGEWTVFRDGQVVAQDLSHSAAREMAESLAFEAEADGQSVELLIQDYYGGMASKVSGGD
ncbi:MAG: hypothetical protein JWP92_2259 [Caulobacter sp.]|nr:hypothetical protein [Caulobacter sp.]